MADLLNLPHGEYQRDHGMRASIPSAMFGLLDEKQSELPHLPKKYQESLVISTSMINLVIKDKITTFKLPVLGMVARIYLTLTLGQVRS